MYAACICTCAFLHLPLQAQNLFYCGPSGGAGGEPFVDDAIPKNSRVYEIQVFAGDFIDAIRLVHENNRSELLELRKHGGPGGQPYVLTLDPDEYLIAIEGQHNKFVHALKFYTNKRTTDWYGGRGGNYTFKYEAPEGYEIVGLSGRAATFLDALGVLFRRR